MIDEDQPPSYIHYRYASHPYMYQSIHSIIPYIKLVAIKNSKPLMLGQINFLFLSW